MALESVVVKSDVEKVLASQKISAGDLVREIDLDG
jgi:hypothetical protein